MGYDLHITRAREWAENLGSHIESEEWLALVERDSELSLDPSNGPFAARWSPGGSEAAGWFDWYEGNVYTTNPTSATVAKMLSIAKALAGKVQGDEGEAYKTATEWSERD